MLAHTKDKEATAKAGFQDKRSYVTFSGRLWLWGLDMEAERRRIFERSKGFCEMPVSDRVAGRLPGNGWTCGRNLSWEIFEAHHEPPKSKGGHDGSMLAVCRQCHRQRHLRVGGRTAGLSV